jgi:hypothetical protein
MVTLPTHERRGIARAIFARLLDWFASKNIARVELEATPAGGPLYRDVFGFVPRWNSMRATLEDQVRAPNPPRAVRVATPMDWPAIAELDRAATGAERSWILEALAMRPVATPMVAVADDGRLEAFGMRTGERLGPIIASSPGAAETLIEGLASLAPGPLAAGTGGAAGVHEFWESLGFELSPFDVRMRWGTEPADKPEMLYAVINGGLG